MITPNDTQHNFDRSAFSADKVAEAREVLVTALADPGRESLEAALSLWTGSLQTGDLSFVCEAFDDEELQTIFRRAANVRGIIPFNFAIALSEATFNADVRRMELEKRPPGEWRHLTKFKPGSIYKGLVSQITQFGAFLTVEDVPAFMHFSQIDWHYVENPADHLQPGEELDIVMLCVDWEAGRIEVSQRHLFLAHWRQMLDKYPIGTRVTGTVLDSTPESVRLRVEKRFAVHVNKGDLGWSNEVTAGQQLDALITSVDFCRQRVNASVHRLAELAWDSAIAKFRVDSEINGTIVALTHRGAIVEVERDVYARLPYAQISWNSCHGKKRLSIGKNITAKVIGIDDSRNLFEISIKARFEDPWLTAEQKFPPGCKVKGKVTEVLEFGAFIEIGPDLRGIVTLHEISWATRKTRVTEHFTVGSEVEAIVVSVNGAERKLHLSVRLLSPNPWDSIATDLPPGTKVRGKVVNLVDYGAFIDIGNGMQGLLHNTDLTLKPGRKAKNQLALGQEIETIVLSTDGPNKRISLGRKQLEEDPWTTIDEALKVGDVVRGPVKAIAPYGVFINLGEHGSRLHEIDGLIHHSTLQLPPGTKAREFFQKGQVLTATVTNIDREQKRITLAPC